MPSVFHQHLLLTLFCNQHHLLREVTYPAFYHPPLAPFFFFCCCFFLVAGAPAGFWCLGGMTLLVADTAAALPGRGEVGGLLAVLLASLQGR